MPAFAPRHPADEVYEKTHVGRFPFTVYPHPQIITKWRRSSRWDTENGALKQCFIWCGDPGQQVVVNFAQVMQRTPAKVKPVRAERFGRKLWLDAEELEKLQAWWKIRTFIVRVALSYLG